MRLNSTQPKYNTSFQAGFTKQLKSEVKSCDIKKIVQNFNRQGISVDFKDNKTLAWCSAKTFDIITNLRKNYRLNLGLPKAIMVEDFNYLRVDNPHLDAFCTVAPTNIYIEKDLVFPENTIFLNEHDIHREKFGKDYWDDIDEISDWEYETKQAPTGSFLYTFLHEFSHVIHNTNLINLFGGREYLKIVLDALSEKSLTQFQNKYGTTLSQLCSAASYSPFEAIGCDLGKCLSQNLNEKTVLPTENILKGSPYLKKTTDSEKKDYDSLINRIFNGNFQ